MSEPIDRPCAFDGNQLARDESVIRPQVVDGAGFTQDDAHIFITEEQIEAESVLNIQLLLSIYKDFGFDNVRVKFADRPPTRAHRDHYQMSPTVKPSGNGSVGSSTYDA